MAASEIKSWLKAARDAVTNKDFKSAQDNCKNVLRKDKNNYMALVLLGVSLQEAEQAPLAFQKAISVDKEKPLAWQGLVNYYEKFNDTANKQKLLAVCKTLLAIEQDEVKLQELLKKVFGVGETHESLLLDSVTVLRDYIAECSYEKVRETAENNFLTLLKSTKLLNLCNRSNAIPFYKEYFDKNVVTDDDLTLNYVKIIYLSNELNLAFEMILDLLTKHNSLKVKEWLCTSLFDKYVETENLNGIDTSKFNNSILEGIENTTAAQLYNCISLYENGDAAQAYQVCNNLIDPKNIKNNILIFMIMCCKSLNKWKDIEKLTLKLINFIQDDVLQLKLKIWLLESLYNQSKWNEVDRLSKDLAIDDLDIEHKAMIVTGVIELGESVQYNEIYITLKETEYYDPIEALILMKENKLQEAKELLETSSCTLYLKWLRLGIANWYLKNYTECLANLLKAAKLQPRDPISFLYLGHYYNTYMNDYEKAKKCYLKAYNLNAHNSDAARSLSEVYRRLGELDSNYQLLKAVSTDMGPEISWTKLQIGLHHLATHQWDDAIINLRGVVRINAMDVDAWESLADGYYSRGSYTSALKCYQKVIELEKNNRSFAQTQKGAIFYLLGMFTEATEMYMEVLKEEPTSLIALKGIAETWLGWSIDKLNQNLFGLSRDGAQKAIGFITQAIEQNNNYACFWNILAEALMTITVLPFQYSNVYIKEFLLGVAGKSLCYKSHLEIYPIAIASYCRAINIHGGVSFYYHLSTCYYLYYKETKDIQHFQRALAAAQHCVQLQSKECRYWSLLGLLYMSSCIKKYNLAQHCFIKALQCDQTYALSWSNLGVLYLKLDYYKLANYAFKKAQQSDPSYLQSWIGQALIAEKYAETEAMDLFRHACQLGYHKESAFGYGDWVCRTLEDERSITDHKFKYAIENLHAIPVGLDVMTWLCENEPKNPSALTIVGMLQERMGLLKSALNSFIKAMEYKENEHVNIAAMNLGRIFIRHGEYEQAVKQFKLITEASLNSACGLALSLYKAGQCEEAYSTYDTALHWLATNDLDKADLLVAIAGIAWKVQGVDDAITILCQSIQLSEGKPSCASLLAACCLSMLHTPSFGLLENLSKLALDQLTHHENDSVYGYDVGFLRSYILLKEKGINAAMKSLSRSIHRLPQVANLWFCLAKYCLQENNLKPRCASVCSQKAICSGTGNVDVTKMLSVASVSELLLGNNKRSLILAQKALHTYPQLPENWAALISVLLPDYIVSRKKWIKDAIYHVRRRLNVPRPLGQWLSLTDRLVEQAI